MPHLNWMVRKFGPAASTISLTNHGGAVLKGIWVSAKGTSPTIICYDSSASVAANAVVNSFVPAPPAWYEFGAIGCGTGLCVKVASCTGSIMYQPPGA